MSQIIPTVGGAGRNTYVVTKGNGSDLIADFQTGASADLVSLQAYGFANFAAVQSAMTQSGGNVVLALGGGQTLTFAGHSVSDFVAANFGMAPSDLKLSATFNPTTHQIELTGNFVNSGAVQIYEALAGKPVGPGTGTGVSTIARGTGTSFLSKLAAWADGTYTIQVIENGVVSTTTVTVATPPVSPPAPTPPPVTLAAMPTPDLHLSATYNATTHQIRLTGDFALIFLDVFEGSPLDTTCVQSSCVARNAPFWHPTRDSTIDLVRSAGRDVRGSRPRRRRS